MHRHSVEQFIHENFAGITQDWPWENSPEFTVFRHVDNKKWFALIMKVKFSVLHLDSPGEVDVINLKSDPDLIEVLRHNPGILPAYHMNKRYWLTLLLDGTCPAEQVKTLINLSYQLTAAKSLKPQP